MFPPAISTPSWESLSLSTEPTPPPSTSRASLDLSAAQVQGDQLYTNVKYWIKPYSFLTIWIRIIATYPGGKMIRIRPDQHHWLNPEWTFYVWSEFVLINIFSKQRSSARYPRRAAAGGRGHRERGRDGLPRWVPWRLLKHLPGRSYWSGSSTAHQRYKQDLR